MYELWEDDPSTPAPRFAIDALLPAEIARRAESLGAHKARLDLSRLIVLSILAGAFIGLGAMFSTTARAGANGVLPFGITRLVGGLVFSLGLILVIVGGAELFTGDTLMVMALAARKITAFGMLRAWGIVYIGNFAGAFGTAILVFLSGQYLFGDGAVTEVALSPASTKASLPWAAMCSIALYVSYWLALLLTIRPPPFFFGSHPQHDCGTASQPLSVRFAIP